MKNVAISNGYWKSNVWQGKKKIFKKGETNIWVDLNMHGVWFPIFTARNRKGSEMFLAERECADPPVGQMSCTLSVLIGFPWVRGCPLDSLRLIVRLGCAGPVVHSLLSFSFLLDAGMISSGSSHVWAVLLYFFVLSSYFDSWLGPRSHSISNIFSHLFFPHMLQWVPVVQLAGLDLEAVGRCSQGCTTHLQLHKQLFMGYFQLPHKQGALRRSFGLVCS